MARVVISACNVASFPEVGGHFWVYLQYAHALRSLGCDIVWLERYRGSGDEDRDAAALEAFLDLMEPHGLRDRVILYRCTHGANRIEYLVPDAGVAAARLRGADLLLNFEYSIVPELLAGFRRSALVDIDPGLLQFWISHGQLQVPAHDVYFTTGETVGAPGSPIPDCGLVWRRIRPAVSLDLWPFAREPAGDAFTTISSWWGDEWIRESDGSHYENNKRVTFLEFAELPRRAPQTLELALSLGPGDAGDRALLEACGWRIRLAAEVASTPERYRHYVRGSRGEFSCAKPSCMRLKNAWVSDRTLCYLASGRPAVVQDTGPSALLPSGRGLFRFSTLDEAADALAAIDADYENHRRAAREIVEGGFDARRVCASILEAAL